MTTAAAANTKPKVAIIGGGLGGLALAHALAKASIPCTVYERDASAEARDQGYLIGVNEQGASVFDRIMFPALEDLVTEASSSPDRLTFFTVTNAHLGVHCVLRSLGRSYGLNRWKLRETLAVKGPALNIEWNKRLQRYEDRGKGNGVVLYFEDGTTAEADVVVGADGAKSRVREQRCPQLQLQDTHIVNIGGVAPMPSVEEAPRLHRIMKNSMARALGTNGVSVLIMPWMSPQSERMLIWSLVQGDETTGAAETPKRGASPDDIVKYCLEQCKDGGIHQELIRLIEKTRPGEIVREGRMLSITWPPSDNPLGATTNVTLLGDAAHAMTSHMGMGGNTAFQDAMDLADALKADDWHAALSKYEAHMMKRGLTNAKNSLFMSNTLIARSWSARMLRGCVFNVFGFFSWVGSFFS